MSDVVTPVQVEQNLRALSRDVDDAYRSLYTAERTYLNAKTAHALAWSKAFLRAEGTNAEARKAEATVAAEPELLALTAAEAVAKSARIAVERLRVQVDLARSQSSLVKSALEL